jgi:hypothetical protein
MSLDSSQSTTYVPSPHEAEQLSYPPAQDGGMIEDDTNISIRTHEELVRFKSLCRREYAHTHVYDVSLLERVGMDLEFPTVFHVVGWEKLYEVPRSGSHLLALDFLTTFESVARGRKSYVRFRLFGREFKFDYCRFSELLYFSSSCLLDPRVIKNFSRVEFCVEISENSSRIRFSDIHNTKLIFLHRWMSFMLFLMRKLHSVTVAGLKCLYAMVHKIWYSPIADIVDYFKEICTLAGCPSSAHLWSPRLL